MRHPWAGLILTSEVSLRFPGLVGSCRSGHANALNQLRDIFDKLEVGDIREPPHAVCRGQAV
jgi:hypothetical protein